MELWVVAIIVAAGAGIGVGLLLARAFPGKEADDLRGKYESVLKRAVEAETALTKDEQSHKEKLAELTNLRGQIETSLQLMAQKSLKENSEQFVKHAKEVFEAQNTEAKKGLETLVKPIGDSLKEYQTKLQEMEKTRKADEGALAQQLRSVAETHVRLHDTTINLVNALRSAPKTRGRWGEQQLRRVLEMAGMIEHVDFGVEQHVESSEHGRQRPDVIIRMPGNRILVVDAKTPMAGYLDAVEATDDDQRELKLKDHARQMRAHAMQLGSKEYWKSFEQTPDFVVMFVPGDNLYAAAWERDPSLFEDAYAKQVIVATPTTFLALAKAISFGWRQERASLEAEQIHKLGTELYGRLVNLGGGVADLGKAIENAVKKHNSLVGTLETRVLPQARKFTELSISDSYGSIPQLAPIESDVREPRGRDLNLGDQTKADAAE